MLLSWVSELLHFWVLIKVWILIRLDLGFLWFCHLWRFYSGSWRVVWEIDRWVFTGLEGSSMAAGQDLIELKFRLFDGTDIGPQKYSPSTTVQSLKEKILAQWPKGLFLFILINSSVKFLFYFILLHNLYFLRFFCFLYHWVGILESFSAYHICFMIYWPKLLK